MCLVQVSEKVYSHGYPLWHAHFHICYYYATTHCEPQMSFGRTSGCCSPNRDPPDRSSDFDYQDYLEWNSRSDICGPISISTPSEDRILRVLEDAQRAFHYDRQEREARVERRRERRGERRGERYIRRLHQHDYRTDGRNLIRQPTGHRVRRQRSLGWFCLF